MIASLLAGSACGGFNAARSCLKVVYVLWAEPREQIIAS